jgi:hypothetical protein
MLPEHPAHLQRAKFALVCSKRHIVLEILSGITTKKPVTIANALSAYRYHATNLN